MHAVAKLLCPTAASNDYNSHLNTVIAAAFNIAVATTVAAAVTNAFAAAIAAAAGGENGSSWWGCLWAVWSARKSILSVSCLLPSEWI